jgi:hypothetical protein
VAGKNKKGKKMHKGPGWTITSPSKAEFTGRLGAVLHVGKGKRVAIFYMRKKKTGK